MSPGIARPAIAGSAWLRVGARESNPGYTAPVAAQYATAFRHFPLPNRVAKTTLRSLLADVIGQVKASPVPIRAVEYDPSSKRLRVEFAPEPVAVVPVAAGAPQAERPRQVEKAIPFIPGTTIPDDDSPVDALELAIARPAYELNGESEA